MAVLERSSRGTDLRVRLVGAPPRPYENAVATARTCYSSRIIETEEVSRDDAAAERRDRIARDTYRAGHHTTLQHAHFQFAIEGVSRLVLWAFFHDHPYYNSEQVSQRYVRVRAGGVVAPPLSEQGEAIYFETAEIQRRAYERLIEILVAPVRSAYARIFPARNADEGRWAKEIEKKAQEVARYVLPLGTPAHLYHTVSGVTLLRYRRLARRMDLPEEARRLVDAMCEAVAAHDSLFFTNAEDPLPAEETPEYRALADLEIRADTPASDEWFSSFDEALGDRVSRLVSVTPEPEAVLGEAVRGVLGVSQEDLPDAEAVSRLLDPARNPLLAGALNLSSHSPLMHALEHVHVTYRKRLSHTADSQDQRHRTVAGSRPLLSRQFRPHRADFIIPPLVAGTPAAEDAYRDVMRETWEGIRRILEAGDPLSSALYLLPNAFPIRFLSTGSLAGLRHKWAMRLCYKAQEEIWRACVEEVRDLEAAAPEIGRWMRPPCEIRLRARATPYCPEGAQYCGVPVWRLGLSEYERIL